MARTLRMAVASVFLCSSISTAATPRMGFNLRVTVAMQCTVRHSATGVSAVGGDMVPLGEIREFCNAPQGYELVVNYAPGTLRGARLSAGSDEVVLNGSGEAVLSRVPGPRVRSRPVMATPGENGFDTDRLLFQLRPA